MACSSDDSDETTVRLPLSVEVSENPPMTRGEITKTSSLSSFLMQGSGTSYSVTKDGTWSSSPDDWPAGVGVDAEVTFYAYSSGTYNDGSNNPYIRLKVENNIAVQKDLLVAKRTTTHSSCGGKVSLTFDHACAAVQFSIAKTASLADCIITVESIVLCNVKNVGKYRYSDGTWFDVGVSAEGTGTDDYKLNTSSITVTETPTLLGSSSDNLFLIPQTLEPWDKSSTLANCYVVLDCEITGAKSYSGNAYIPFGITLEKGYIQPITISIGTGLRKGDGSKVF